MNLVKDDCVDKFICEVGAAYQEKIGYTADFYVVDVGTVLAMTMKNEEQKVNYLTNLLANYMRSSE